MLKVQRYLESHTLKELKNEFDIKITLYDDRVVLNYGIKSPKYHDITKECRGLILSTFDYNILARSFDRFYNYGEGDDKDIFKWENVEITEKMDGSLINVYFDNNKWCIATRSRAFAEGKNSLGGTYYNMFIEAIGCDLQKAFNEFNRYNTYIFELTSPKNRIVHQYKSTKATLLAVRNNITGTFVKHKNLNDELSPCFNVVKTYNFNSFNDIIEFVESRNALDEGCVCWDGKTRIKIKNSAYVAIHHIKGNEVTIKSIVALLFKNEIDEFLAYFPEYTDIFMKYINAYKKLKDDIKITYEKFKSINDKKEFALAIKDYKFKSVLFALKKGNNLDDFITERFLINYFKGI